jgi:hypothetical protein
MRFDAERVRANVRKATTEDLLDRVTVYRAGMEPEALDIIEGELRQRGVDLDQIEEHARRREGKGIPRADGAAARCLRCRNPAVTQEWGWHRLWGLVPVFPRRFYFCEEHRPRARQHPSP